MNPIDHAGRLVRYMCLVALGFACTAKHHADGTADAASDATADAIPAPPCTPFDTTIPATGIYSSPVWIGDEYLVAVSGGASADTILQVVSGDGVLGGQFATIPQAEGTLTSHPVWSGSSLGVLVTSSTANTFELVRFDHDGTRLGQTTMMKNNMFESDTRLVWANDRFAVAWIDMSNSTVNLQEISRDGVLGTARQLTMTDVGTYFNSLDGFVSTATSYAISLEYFRGAPVIVVIHRVSGAIAHYASDRFSAGELAARDPVFALFASGSPAQFRTVDASATPGWLVNLPLAGFATLLPTTAGYHVYDLISTGDPAAMTSELDAMDLDARGFSTGPEVPITTISWPATAAERTGGAGAAFRGNGYAAFLGYGSGTTFTLRMLQQCIP